MNARSGWYLCGSFSAIGWFGSVPETWDDRRRITHDGGVRIDPDDILLARAARRGLIQPTYWTVTADAARITIYHSERDPWT
jgi:hypothetical protein